MSVLRNTVNNKFTIIQNDLITLEISDLSFRVACYLLSRPDGWQVCNVDIMRKLRIKQQPTLAKIWRELLNAGVIYRKAKPKQGGKFQSFDYAIGDLPEGWTSEKTAKSTDSGLTVNGDTGDHIKTELNNTDRNIEIEHQTPASSRLKVAAGFESKVGGTQSKTVETCKEKRLAVKDVASAGYRYSTHCLGILRDLQAKTSAKICLTIRASQLQQIETNLTAIAELDDVDLYEYLGWMVERATGKNWLNLAYMAGIGMMDENGQPMDLDGFRYYVSKVAV